VKTKSKPKPRKVAASKTPASETAVAKELESIQSDVRPATAAEKEPIDEWVSVPCPFCGESFDVHVTSDEEGQTMYEDCEVCCRPVSLHITFEDGEVHVGAHRS
jgi:hypothetical protein